MGQSWDIGHNPVQGGNYLPNVTATLNQTTGILTISGNGNMADFWCTGDNQYGTGGEAPWWFNEVRLAINFVVIEGGVQNIGMRAFKDCSNLKTVTIPSSVNNINGQAFFYCSSLHTVIIENGAGNLEFRGYRSSNPCGTSGTINTYDWFEGCTSLTNLHLGRNLTNWYASSDNRSPIFNIRTILTTLTIGNTVTSIGSAAFNNCSSLKNVEIQDGTVLLTFSGTYSNGHFKNSPIETLVLGRNLRTTASGYNGYPFAENPALKTLTVSDYVKDINDNSFYNCTGLQSLTIIGNELRTIGSNAFYGCSSLASVLNIPQGVSSIGSGAFQGCLALPSVSIPNSVTSIGSTAFNNCSSLKNVEIQDGTVLLTFSGTYSNGHFKNSPIETLVLGRNLRTTASGYNGYPFAENSSLKTLTIGNDVTIINANGFLNCTGLMQITSPCPPTIQSTTFNGVNKDIPVYIDCNNCLTAYRTAQFWNEFTNYWDIDTQERCELGIEDITSSQFVIYPNPTTGELRIENGELRIEEVEIFDIYGKKLLSHNSNLINISHLSAGIYFVKIRTEAGEITRKILKK